MSQDTIEVNFTVDWISVTFDVEKAKGFCDEILSDIPSSEISSHPSKGYNAGFLWESGVHGSYHTEREDMGVHLVFSGSALRFYYAHGVEWKNLFERIGKHGGRTSRVDLAFDIKNSKMTAGDLCKPNQKPYKGKGRTPRLNTLIGSDGSWTVYIGSRQSEKFLRVYDKAKEQGDFSGDYIRIELETKGEIGRAVGWNFARENQTECVAMARGLALGVADYDLAGWNAAFRGDILGLSLPQAKQRDTFGWLLKSCVPALAKEIALHPSDDVLGEFWNALRRELAQRGIETPEGG